MKSVMKKQKIQRQLQQKLPCGVIMSISEIDGCNETHWNDVREIIFDAVEGASFEPHLVSEADDVGIIQKRIIQNLYDNPIVVCDVSGKNPNVMFELGMRLAFDKPCVIVKDDKTTYSFDTAPIEHIEYPRDLRFGRIVEFKDELSDKIKATAKKAVEDGNYTTFLKHFGSFAVAKLDTRNISKDEFMLEEIRSLRRLILDRRIEQPFNSDVMSRRSSRRALCLHGISHSKFDELMKSLAPILKNVPVEVKQRGSDHVHIMFMTEEDLPLNSIMDVCRSFTPNVRIMRGPRV